MSNELHVQGAELRDRPLRSTDHQPAGQSVVGLAVSSVHVVRRKDLSAK